MGNEVTRRWVETSSGAEGRVKLSLLRRSRLAGLIVFVALLHLIFFYEIFPRPGWVDASIYTGYSINADLYKIYDLGSNSYQGSRLGYILPLRLLSHLFGNMLGREVYPAILYVICSISIWAMCVLLVEGTRARVLTAVCFIFNPLLVSALVYGGADGPAATYMLTCFIVLAKSGRANEIGRQIALSFLSGVFVCLALSSHIFSVVPALITIPCLLYQFHSSRRRTITSVASLATGMLVTMAILAALGFKLGLTKFYLLYSIPWIHKSLNGSGIKFSSPFSIWIKNSILWMPFVLLLTLSVSTYLRSACDIGGRLVARRLSQINLGGPLVAFICFDQFVGGDLLGTPSYLNIVYPTLFVGSVLFVSTLPKDHRVDAILRPVPDEIFTKYATIFIACFGLILCATSGYVKSAFSFSKTDSRGFYSSQVEFNREITAAGLSGQKLQFLFLSTPDIEKSDSRIYTDFYRDKTRNFDYIDSLVSLFLWDRSIALRIDPKSNTEASDIELNKSAPLVLLGRNKMEIERIISKFPAPLAAYSRNDFYCFENPNYPWCFVRLAR
jgi:hypothetical protein